MVPRRGEDVRCHRVSSRGGVVRHGWVFTMYPWRGSDDDVRAVLGKGAWQ
ncbi:hypothetical protein [Nonomuraea sp. NPDC002799]